MTIFCLTLVCVSIMSRHCRESKNMALEHFLVTTVQSVPGYWGWSVALDLTCKNHTVTFLYNASFRFYNGSCDWWRKLNWKCQIFTKSLFKCWVVGLTFNNFTIISFIYRKRKGATTFSGCSKLSVLFQKLFLLILLLLICVSPIIHFSSGVGTPLKDSQVKSSISPAVTASIE